MAQLFGSFWLANLHRKCGRSHSHVAATPRTASTTRIAAFSPCQHFPLYRYSTLLISFAPQSMNSPSQNAKWVACLGVLALNAAPLFCVPITWTFTNAVFNDGGTAVGYFVYDADASAITNWNIVTSAGSTLPAFTYTPATSTAGTSPSAGCPAPCISFGSNQQFPDGMFSETRYLSLTLVTPLTDSGGTVGLNLNYSDECLNCSPYRLFTQGSVLGAPASNLSVTPTTLNFQLPQGASPQSQSVQIGGMGGVAWQATVTSTGGAWLSVSPASGQIPASITAVVNPSGLTPAQYQGSIVIRTTGGMPSSSTITVSLTVSAANGQGSIITTVAGDGPSCGLGSAICGSFSGDSGTAISAGLNGPSAVAVDNSGNLFIADTVNNRIRKVSASGIITTVAGNGPSCVHLLSCGSFSGDGGLATSAGLNDPASVAVDASGNLFIADYLNNRIRKVSTNGIITTVAGNASCCGFSGDGGQATSASLYNPSGIAVDASGNLFIADTLNNRIRKVSASGIITTVAGNPPRCNLSSCGGFSGDGGQATSAELNYPQDVAVDASGNLFIADSKNGRIRKVSTSSIITTVAGIGACQVAPCGNFKGDGGLATSAYFVYPTSVAVDASGNLFIADESNVILYVSASSGVIKTVAGYQSQGFSGDGGPATSASLDLAGSVTGRAGVAVDASGNLFIADPGNNRIREVSANLEASVRITTLENGASFAQSFAPGMLMSVFGTGLSTGSPQTVSTSPLPLTSLSGTSVTINGIAAPLLYISATQINLQIPYEVSPGPATLTVNTGGHSASFSFTIQAAAPGVFLDFQNGHVVPNESAAAGSTIGLFLTGAGQVSPSEATGNVPNAGTAPVPNLPLTMTVGSVSVTPVYAAIPDWSVGVLQVNFTVPATLAAGTYPVVVTIGGVASQIALLTVTSPGGDSACTGIGGNWNASESGSANFSIVAPIESDAFTDPLSGKGSVEITQTGCTIQYEPISESGLIGANLTPSQLASLTRTGTVSGDNVTVTGMVALVDTVTATQSGLTITNVSSNVLAASGQVVGNVMTLNETGNFAASGTYSISGQIGQFMLTIATSSTATFDWASGTRPEDLTPTRRQIDTRGPFVGIHIAPSETLLSSTSLAEIRALLRTALKRAIIIAER